MEKDMIERIKKQGTVDTAKYRYWMKDYRIYRIEREHLDTTAALHFDDDFCPNGWHTVAVIGYRIRELHPDGGIFTYDDIYETKEEAEETIKEYKEDDGDEVRCEYVIIEA